MATRFPFLKVFMKDGKSGIREKYMEDSLIEMGLSMKVNSRIICLMEKEKQNRSIL
jgi:hypothetical protein